MRSCSLLGGCVALAVALLTSGCPSRREPPKREAAAARDAGATPRAPAHDAAPEADAAAAWYRVEATVDALGTVPFLIGVHPTKPEGWIWSAEERLPLVVEQRDPLVLRIAVRGVTMRLEPDGATGRLRGHWQVTYFFDRDFALVAEPIAAPSAAALFPGDAPPTVDLSGTWRIDIDDFGVGRAILAQDASGVVTGTIIPPEVGDLRHLTGRITGATGRLSTFDGIHGFFLELTASDGGARFEGRWLIAGIGAFPFRATREAAPATHMKVSARLKPGKTRVTLPQLEQPPYKGNPVIVDYFGTWCPVCLDLTPHLVRLRKQHEAAGLQILSIALEPEGDEAETRRRLDEFRAAFGITWPMELRFTEDFQAAVPPEVEGATGFPVTIFVRRDGTVAGVHTGFISPAAAEEHAAVVAHFDALTAEIVASPPAR